MNIDLLPFSAFALESCPPQPQTGDSQTLTLQLALVTRSASLELMAGILSTRDIAPTEALLRASVVPADATPLTITF